MVEPVGLSSPRASFRGADKGTHRRLVVSLFRRAMPRLPDQRERPCPSSPSKTYLSIRSETLFASLNFSIAKGDRVELVAANGRGKSSLLRVLASEDDATTGAITRARSSGSPSRRKTRPRGCCR